MKHKVRKSIAYAYPTSPRSKELGVRKTGGWFIQHYRLNEAGEWSTPYVPAGAEAEVFDRPDHPDLISLYHEYSDAEPCPSFLRHGNERALAAVKSA